LLFFSNIIIFFYFAASFSILEKEFKIGWNNRVEITH
jgi:hypothetical protein